MRTGEEIIAIVLRVAKTDERIRAVLITGSRADPGIVKDSFQDFDIIYVVSQLSSFITDHSWIDIFGERLIIQLPEEMTVGAKDEHAYHYLMLFKDGNRIDLMLLPLDNVTTYFAINGPATLLVDKDKVFDELFPQANKNYLIKRPTQKEFSDVCNEFWWVSTYIAKGLWRKEIIYAKEMMDNPVRAMFLKMIEWHIGVTTRFTVSFGKAGRFMSHHLPPELYQEILCTYPDSDPDKMWRSLFLMADLFDDLARQNGQYLNFIYDEMEANNVKGYLKAVNEDSKLSRE